MEPWGQVRDDYRFACLAAIVVNALGLVRLDKQPWLAHHFLKEFQDSWKVKHVPLPAPAVVPDEPKVVPFGPKQSTDPENIERWIDLWVRGSNQRMREQRKKRH